MRRPPALRVLVFQDLPGRWSARGLEHDFAVEGRDLDAVLDRMLQLIFAHVEFDRRHGRAPLSTFPPAPSRFWDAFAGARPHRLVRRRTVSGMSYGDVLISILRERPAMKGAASRIGPTGGDQARQRRSPLLAR